MLYLEAIADSRNALAWSSTETIAFDAIDAVSSDWRQSQDLFENGSEWKALRIKRVTRVQEEILQRDQATKRLIMCASRAEIALHLVEETVQKTQMERAREVHERAALLCEEMHAAAVCASMRNTFTVKLLLSRLTLRGVAAVGLWRCLLYTSPSPRD